MDVENGMKRQTNYEETENELKANLELSTRGGICQKLGIGGENWINGKDLGSKVFEVDETCKERRK